MDDSNGYTPRSRKSRKERENEQKYRETLEEVKNSESDFITGEKDLTQNLEKVDEMYSHINTESGINKEAILDSDIVRKQSEIINVKVKTLQTNLRRFKPVEFAEKVLTYLDTSLGPKKKTSLTEPWLRIGEIFKTKICTGPSFHFMYGAFEPGEVEMKKRRRTLKEKDLIGEEVKPKSVSLEETKAKQDETTQKVEHALSVLHRLYRRENRPICYFEFVINHTSFAHTVENMFHVSFLVKEGAVKIINDQDNLPALVPLNIFEQGEHAGPRQQSVLSISIDEWKILKMDCFGAPRRPALRAGRPSSPSLGPGLSVVES